MKEIQELLPLERAAERLEQLMARREKNPAAVQYLTAGSWHETAVLRYYTADTKECEE